MINTRLTLEYEGRRRIAASLDRGMLRLEVYYWHGQGRWEPDMCDLTPDEVRGILALLCGGAA